MIMRHVFVRNQERGDLTFGFVTYFERSCTVILDMLGRARVIERRMPGYS